MTKLDRVDSHKKGASVDIYTNDDLIDRARGLLCLTTHCGVTRIVCLGEPVVGARRSFTCAPIYQIEAESYDESSTVEIFLADGRRVDDHSLLIVRDEVIEFIEVACCGIRRAVPRVRLIELNAGKSWLQKPK